MVAGSGAGGAVSRGIGIAGRAFACDGAVVDLRAWADCAGADSIGAETFSRGSGRACFARRVSEWNLQECGGAGGRSESGGDSAVRGGGVTFSVHCLLFTVCCLRSESEAARKGT